jgi:cytochrome c peroxidase
MVVNMLSKNRKILCLLLIAALSLAMGFTVPWQHDEAKATSALTDIAALGKALFFDTNLSQNRNQSCASCHDPAVGYTGPDSLINAGGAVYAGSVNTLFGNSKPPSAAYAGDSPALSQFANGWTGGMFYDGRADGSKMGDPLAEQAKGPFLNPLEMALTSPAQLRDRVKEATYSALFEKAWGAGSLDANPDAVYDQIGKSLAAYERSSEVNPFNSKFDQFWDTAGTKKMDVTQISGANWPQYRNLGLTDAEVYGLAVFNDPLRANCASCHSLKLGSQGYPLFTDYRYDNLGVPRNPQNPFYDNLAYNPEGVNWVDIGLGGYLEKVQPASAASEIGKVKTPTLRNVDKRPSMSFVKAYGHNGYFKSLPEVLNFYMMRSMGGMMGMMGGMGVGRMGMGMNGMMGMGMNGMMGMGMGGMMMFGPPEVNENLAMTNGLFFRDQPYVLAFLKTLSDGYFQR